LARYARRLSLLRTTTSYFIALESRFSSPILVYFTLHTFSLMAKAQDARKEKKKEPTKTTKEKKAEKDEKKVARARKQE
jgi:hypothetical protein